MQVHETSNDQEQAASAEPLSRLTLDSALASRPSAPRLRIAHWLLWTACTAAILTLYRLLTDPGGLAERQSALMATWAFLAGPSLAALCVFPFWRRAGYRFPSHAGEWLLLWTGSAFVLIVVQGLVMRALWDWTSLDSGAFERVLRVSSAIQCAVMGLLAVLGWGAAASLKGRAAWRYFFSALAVPLTWFALAAGVRSVGAYTDFFEQRWLLTFLAFLPLALIVAVIGDVRRRPTLPWTHWLGVVLFVLQAGALFGARILQSVATE